MCRIQIPNSVSPASNSIDFSKIWSKSKFLSNFSNSFIFQDSTLFTHLSAYENVSLSLLLNNMQTIIRWTMLIKIHLIFSEILEDYSTIETDK